MSSLAAAAVATPLGSVRRVRISRGGASSRVAGRCGAVEVKASLAVGTKVKVRTDRGVGRNAPRSARPRVCRHIQQGRYRITVFLLSSFKFAPPCDSSKQDLCPLLPSLPQSHHREKDNEFYGRACVPTPRTNGAGGNIGKTPRKSAQCTDVSLSSRERGGRGAVVRPASLARVSSRRRKHPK